MKAKLQAVLTSIQGFVQRQAVAALMLAFMLMTAMNANAVDYDPASLSSGVATLFQGAIAIAGVIAATLIGIRIVKKALRAA